MVAGLRSANSLGRATVRGAGESGRAGHVLGIAFAAGTLLAASDAPTVIRVLFVVSVVPTVLAWLVLRRARNEQAFGLVAERGEWRPVRWRLDEPDRDLLPLVGLAAIVDLALFGIAFAALRALQLGHSPATVVGLVLLASLARWALALRHVDVLHLAAGHTGAVLVAVVVTGLLLAGWLPGLVVAFVVLGAAGGAVGDTVDHDLLQRADDPDAARDVLRRARLVAATVGGLAVGALWDAHGVVVSLQISLGVLLAVLVAVAAVESGAVGGWARPSGPNPD